MTLGRIVTGLTLAATLCGAALAQSSSLYVQDERREQRAATVRRSDGVADRLSPAIARVSLVAVPLPEPRRYAMNDLVTIIVRESTENRSDATLETTKDTKLEGEISEFPKIQLADLLQMQLGANTFPNGRPRVGIEMKKEFEGDGEFQRRDTFVTRLTARIIDVKPNGLLVLEARKYMRTDKETLSLVITGACRSEDIAADNSVLSTNLADLRVVKEHDGEIRKATKKGILTRIFEGLFAF